MGGVIGRKRELIARHGLAKSQEGAVAHRERGKTDQEYSAQPDPPGARHTSML
jgi:hypothetical protein